MRDVSIEIHEKTPSEQVQMRYGLSLVDIELSITRCYLPRRRKLLLTTLDCRRALPSVSPLLSACRKHRKR